jgi:formylglycine-generating enzyme required for sulfatase activity
VKDFRRYADATNYRQTGGIKVMKVKTSKDGSRSLAWEVDENASWEQPGFAQTGDHPVVGVSWNEAREFCAWLSKEEGRTYRLPTDEEWSAAVGSGKYPWGGVWPPPKGAGNYADKTFIASLPGKGWTNGELGNYDDDYARTSSVGTYSANRLGLYDMGGNVWQWCEDEYRASMNSAEALKKHPILKNEKASDGTAFRVLRGGSWNGGVEIYLRSTCRDNIPPASRIDINGFRCVVVVSGG